MSTRPRPLRGLLATLAAAATLLSPSMVAQPAAQAQTQAENRPAIAWEDCPAEVNIDRAQCGRVTVPTYYGHPDRGTISVGFVKVPAANPSARRGALFTNPGGPGGDAYGWAGNDAIAWPQAVRDEWDVIGVQPRGLPGSTPVRCEEAGGSEADVFLAYGKLVRDACEKGTPGYTNSLTTENTARDWEEVRKALGEDRISIAGLSYGTFLGSTYATLFPQHTDRVVLDSAMGTSLTWNGILPAQRAGYEGAYHDLFAYIAANDARFHLGTTPLAVYERWAARIQRESGVRPTTLPPSAKIGDLPPGLEVVGQPGADLITATGALRANANFLADKVTHPNSVPVTSTTFAITREVGPRPETWEKFAEHLAGQRDMAAEGIGGLSEQDQQQFVDATMQAQNMQALIMCNENTVPGDFTQLPLLVWSNFVTGDFNDLIPAMWGSGTACSGRGPVATPVKLSGAHLATRPLMISGTRDPQTPYRYQGEIRDAMGAHQVTVNGPGHGHFALGNKAVDDIVVDYLRAGHTAATSAPGLH